MALSCFFSGRPLFCPCFYPLPARLLALIRTRYSSSAFLLPVFPQSPCFCLSATNNPFHTILYLPYRHFFFYTAILSPGCLRSRQELTKTPLPAFMPHPFPA